MERMEKSINYHRIAKAIQFILEQQEVSPSLEKIANHIHLSPFHFHRLFQEWAGTTPKKFLQYINIVKAKKILTYQKSLAESSNLLGLSSSSRLHDLFVKIEAMTPTEYQNGGASLTINYSFHDSVFGQLLIASTSKGICYINFIDDRESGLIHLNKSYPNARYIHEIIDKHLKIVEIFNNPNAVQSTINVHLKGTDFQIKVWEALLKIPIGQLKTYGDIAKSINQPSASRAVGTAIGSNPLAYLIPCHRVIQASGILGEYRWTPIRKTAIISWEALHSDSNPEE